MRHSGGSRAAPGDDANFRGERLHHMPDYPFCHTFTPSPPGPADAPEQLPTADASSGEPVIKQLSDPAGQRDRADVAGFANEVHDGPVFFSLLEVLTRQLHGFVPP